MTNLISQDIHKGMTDEQLVRISLQNEDFFYFLIKRYEPILLRYIKRMTRINQEESEDLLQNIFIKIYRNLNGFNTNLKFSTWAYRIAHNEIISQYRSLNRRISLVESASDNEAVQPLTEFPANTLDGQAHYLKRENAAKVAETLERLPPKYREILVLRYFEDLSYKEMGDILRIPIGSVATLVNRAKSKFKKIAMRHRLDGLYENNE